MPYYRHQDIDCTHAGCHWTFSGSKESVNRCETVATSTRTAQALRLHHLLGSYAIFLSYLVIHIHVNFR